MTADPNLPCTLFLMDQYNAVQYGCIDKYCEKLLGRHLNAIAVLLLNSIYSLDPSTFQSRLILVLLCTAYICMMVSVCYIDRKISTKIKKNILEVKLIKSAIHL
ncbi:hypothetical protein CHS0354_029003 [Potamilus streckersoni]|uniref:Uncharacterized protein n=1 Tax=Potamilus streckersoni TaxID=2493646 RepID=A0AAE0SFR9_9BIVA|nr:hypothetical protein CHS0354_029003 [Potamilus streckersoni]